MTSPEDLRVTHAELIERAEEVADYMTRKLVPEALQRLGFRFAFDTTPLPVLSEKPDQGRTSHAQAEASRPDDA